MSDLYGQKSSQMFQNRVLFFSAEWRTCVSPHQYLSQRRGLLDLHRGDVVPGPTEVTEHKRVEVLSFLRQAAFPEKKLPQLRAHRRVTPNPQRVSVHIFLCWRRNITRTLLEQLLEADLHHRKSDAWADWWSPSQPSYCCHVMLLKVSGDSFFFYKQLFKHQQKQVIKA